ncbi:TPA: carboxymuconolactone decarboxylase family protein [Escherichia coli]
MKNVLTILVVPIMLGVMVCQAHELASNPRKRQETMNLSQDQLSTVQQALVPVAAFSALGNMSGLNRALNQGLDNGLTISDAREVLIQLYAYAGFPRSLNALSELMTVLNERKQRGIKDSPGKNPGPLPSGNEVLAVGTENQSKLVGGPVRGALFDFAPAIDQYLKAHLFGDIFARDNLDWKSRELATVAALAAMQGVDAQLRSHLQISLNVGLTPGQLRELPKVFEANGEIEAARRLKDALQDTLK